MTCRWNQKKLGAAWTFKGTMSWKAKVFFLQCKHVFSNLCWTGAASHTKWFDDPTRNVSDLVGIRHKIRCCGWDPTQNQMLRLGSDTKSDVAAGIWHKIRCCGWDPTQNQMLRPGSDTKSYVAAGIRHKIMCCRWSPAQHVVTNFSNSIRFCCLIILQFWVVCPSSCWIFGNLCQVLPSKRCGTQFRDQQYTNCASWVGARSHKKCGSGNCRCVNLEHMNVAMQHTHTHTLRFNPVSVCQVHLNSFSFSVQRWKADIRQWARTDEESQTGSGCDQEL